MKGIQKILIIILLASAVFQLVQFVYPVIEIKPLAGVTNQSEIQKLTFSSWTNEEFQDRLTKYIDYNFGFRPILIRLYNQIQFSLYKKAHGNSIVLGKNNFLFQEPYILEYTGEYNTSEKKISENISKLEAIRKFLNQYNTELLIVLTPGKPYYYPEYIPDYYVRKSQVTYYSRYRALLEKSSVPMFDVNGWFMDLKEEGKTPPLFTQTGTHWSEYGAKLAADSLIKLSGKLLHRPMNLIHITDVEWSNEMQNSDDDLEQLMNIYCPVNTMTAAYPIYDVETKIPYDERPAIIVDSDSFFWLLYDGVLDNSFRFIEYLYYYKTLYSYAHKNSVNINDVGVLLKLINTDMVILMTSTSNLYDLGFGFIDDIYNYINLAKNQKIERLTQDFLLTIPEDSIWMEKIKEKAAQRKISVDSMLKLDAAYMAKRSIKE